MTRAPYRTYVEQCSALINVGCVDSFEARNSVYRYMCLERLNNLRGGLLRKAHGPGYLAVVQFDGLDPKANLANMRVSVESHDPRTVPVLLDANGNTARVAVYATGPGGVAAGEFDFTLRAEHPQGRVFAVRWSDL